MRALARKLVSSFVQGLLALLPLLVSLYLGVILVKFVGRIIDDALILLPRDMRDVPLWIFLTEAGVVVAFFVLVAALGSVVRTMFGRTVVRGLDRTFAGIPVLAPVYRATRQVVDVVSGRPQRFFTRPVLVEYPSGGIWSVAFHTGPAPAALSPDPSEEYVTVFIPTTPNPTSGWLAVVPARQVRALAMSVEDAMKLVLTGGVVKG